MSDGLKLRAKDADDIQVISAMLQDSIMPLCDMTFRQDDNTFIAVVQRVRREAGEKGGDERVCCALSIKGVKGVRTHGIDQNDPDKMLDLLAIILEPANCLNLIFAGEGRIRLDLNAWAGVVEDFGEPWPTLCHPCHDSSAKKNS